MSVLDIVLVSTSTAVFNPTRPQVVKDLSFKYYFLIGVLDIGLLSNDRFGYIACFEFNSGI
jgi:hypothetical protein